MAKPDPTSVSPDRLEQMAKMILADLSDAGRGNTASVLQMYEMALDELAVNAPELIERITNRAAAIESGEYEA